MSPCQVYAHLYEAFHLNTPFNPHATENQQMINIAFVSQAQGNKVKIAKTGGIHWNEC
jgi:hypothetical protein